MGRCQNSRQPERIAMTCRTSVVAIVVLALLVPGLIAAQSAGAPSGHWEGAIQIPAQELKIEIDLEKKSDTWNGTITIPAQGLKAHRDYESGGRTLARVPRHRR